MFFIDEISSPFSKDLLKKKLLEIKEIPNAKYLVENERVFVFDALVQEVQKLSRQPENQSLEELARQALSNAWISAIEAVSQWKIVPVPYQKVELDGQLAILQKPFNALLPGRYIEESDCDRDLAKLLLGQTIEGEGEFVFGEQSMSLRDSLDPSLLPPRPMLEVPQALNNSEIEQDFNYLSGLTYQPGFSPLSKDYFDLIKKLESDWASFNSRVKKTIYLPSNLQLIWSRTEGIEWMRWDVLVTSKEAQEDLRQLRQCYRELKTISDSTLYWLYDDYQRDCCYMNSWDVYRDNEFLFFLLGILCTPRGIDGKEVLPVGEFVGDELLRGQSLESAVEAGKAWFAYNQAIYNLAYRVSEVIKFFYDCPDVRRGKPVVVFEDWFDQFRRLGSQSIVSEQSLENLR